MEELQRARDEITRIDAQIAALFEQRMEAVGRIAAEKQALGLPLRDPDREAALLRQIADRIADPALRPYYAPVQQAFFAASRAWQAELARRPSPREQARFTVRLPGGTCPISIGRGLLAEADRLFDLGRRVFLVTDDGVPAQYAGTVAALCESPVIYTVPQGEASKSPARLTDLLEAMLRAGLTRRDCVVAVGGGVVGDLAGLAAALYMRGVDFCSVPTTLLAMADASVGGKTAVDLAGVKNAAGAFRQPKAVLIDPEVLATLPPRQVSNGLAEIVKMALTLDADLFARFEDPAGPGPIEDLIAGALRLKIGIVEADEREAGPRRVLNFGHTLGHGIEAACEGRLLHGECVALGMLPLCAPAVRERLLPVLRRLDLPTAADFDPEAALAAIAHDKKGTGDAITVVTVPAVGEYRFESLPLSALRPCLQELLSQESGQNAKEKVISNR